MTYVYYTIIFFIGAFLGFILHWWLRYRASYSGTIYVTTEDEKTLYSLELEDYPETIAFQKEVVFKVETSEADSDRG
jgi:hypothetical protein